MKKIEPQNMGEVVLYQPDERTQLEVRLEDETVWLTQQQMSELFDVKEHTITYHIKEIYKSQELDAISTARKIRVVRKEGNRQVNRQLDFYNLDKASINEHPFLKHYKVNIALNHTHETFNHNNQL